MNINKHCRLFLRDVYLYDITACHYTILQQMNIDVPNVDPNDKLQRNIQIGLMMRDNPSLTSLLRNVTISTVSEYLLRNNISDDDIIIRQYDGVIVTKLLKVTTDQFLPLDLQSTFQVFLISSDRTRYIAFDGQKNIIKGVPYRYPGMDEMFGKILRLNYINKTAIFKGLQRIKDEIFESTDPSLFCIQKGENKYSVFLKTFGETEISETLADHMDTAEIDRNKYYDFYIRPFAESICLEFLNDRKGQI